MNRRDSHKRLSHYNTVPAQEFYQQPKIYHYLRESVKGQDTTLNRLACTLMALLACHEASVFAVTLAGASGSGKKTTIQAVRSLLGMQEGQYYAKQYIEIEGGTVSDCKAIAGGREGVKLVKRLNRAKKVSEDPDTGKKPTLPYIVLCVEHLDKAAASFIDAVIAPLLDKRQCLLTSGESFQLPPKTPLLILFTSNCASEEIAAMRNTDDVMASDLICRALCKRWPENNTANHVGTILPYYPLEEETLRPVLMRKFEEYVAQSHLTNRFGINAVHYSPDVKTLLVDHVLARVNARHGAEGSIGQLFQRLELLFSTGLGVIETLVSEEVRYLPKPILVSTHSIDTHRFAESLDEKLDHVMEEFTQSGPMRLSTSKVIDSIFTNPENQQIMARCDTEQPGTVNAVTMAYGDRPLCSLVVNINYTNIQVINHRDQHEQLHSLKNKLHAYKNTLKELINTIDASSKERSFTVTLKKIADAKRELIESSSGSNSEEDEEEYRPTRKRLHEGAQSPASTVKRIRLHYEDPEQVLLEYSDEVDLYLRGDVPIRIASKRMEEEVEQEEEDEEEMMYDEEDRLCDHCGILRPQASFVRKRRDKTGHVRCTETKYCNSCRACRK